MTDIKKFGQTLESFLDLMRTIIKSSEKRNLKLTSGRNPILSRLEKYIKTYDKTEPEEHVWYFRKIYESNHPAILRGPGRDNWIKTGPIIIQFGEEVGAVTDIKIHLTVIYNTACKLRDEIQNLLKGLPGSDQAEEFSYPSLFLLHLYQLFYEVAEEKDEKEKLATFISVLEKETHSQSKTKNNNSDPLSGIMGTMADLMGQMGVKLPEGQKMPSQDELGKMLGSVMNNPQTKSMLGNVMQEMKECKSIGDVVNKLVGNLGAVNPENLQSGLQDTQEGSNYDNGENMDGGDDEFLDN
jgi:hypothetical protein